MAADGTDDTNDMESGTAPRLSRRRAIQGAAWSVPAITVATAAPAYAGSGTADSLVITTPVAPTFSATNRDTAQTLSATLTNGGNPVPGATVTFSATGSPAWLSFSNAAVTTDGSGVATTSLQYGTPKPAPGTTVTVTASYQALTAVWTLTYLPDVVIVRAGDGAAALGSGATAAFLEEFKQDGSTVPAGTIALPTAVSGSNRRLTVAGSSTSEGALFLSSDRRYLSVAGYDAAVGTASVAGTTSAVANRVVGRLGSTGGVDTTTALTDAATAAFRAAASVDGSAFWVAGASGGTRYASFAATTSTNVATVPGNVRVTGVYAGQVYLSTGSAPTGIYAVGTGLPTTAGATTSIVVAATSPYGFVFLERSDSVVGLDSLYVADDSASPNGGILKFSFDGTAWTARGSFRPGSAGARGLTGFVSADGSVTLFATTTDNRLVKVVDIAAFNATIDATQTTLATAAVNTAYRGVALAPDA